MELLLDTCTFLWIVSGDPRLSDRARSLVTDPENEVYLSAASTWEIAVKHTLGKLPLPADPLDYIPEQRRRHGIEPLPIHESATLLSTRLSPVHRDPFDRLLICQALDQALTLVTPDDVFRKYPVKVSW